MDDSADDDKHDDGDADHSFEMKSEQKSSDLGTECDDDTTTVATEAFIFMVVPLNASWKPPVVYFLIVGMSGVECANLVHQCLCKLADIGVWIESITCDGPSCHVTMLETLEYG